MPNKRLSKSTTPQDVRHRAEQLIRKTRTEIAHLPVEDVQALVYELQVHQAELEIQNEELRQTQVRLQEAQEELEARVAARTQELRHENEFNKQLLDTAQAVILLLDVQGRVVRFNRYLAELSGYTLEEVQGQDWFDTFISERDQPRIRQVFHTAISGTPTVGNVNPIRTRHGQERYIEWYDTPYTDEQGKLAGLLCIGHDITERLNAEKALTESEERFRATFEQAAVGMAHVRADGRWLRVNQRLCDIVGYSCEELLELTFQEITHPDDLEADLNYVHRLISGEISTYTMEKRYLRKDGSTVWVNLSVSPLHNPAGHLESYISVIQDITDRKWSEQALQESESRLKAIVNTAADAIVTINKDGLIHSFNPAAEHMFGYSAGEVIGRKVNLLMPSPYREEHDQYLHRYLETGETRIIGSGREVAGRRKDGSIFPIDLAVSVIDHLGMFTGILRDITERKALQRQILDIAAAEQRRIGQDLHDGVGQELTGLSLMADTLATLLQKKTAPEAELAARITRGIQETLDRVKTLSRGLIPVDVDAEGLMGALAELAGRLHQESGVECHFLCTTAVPIRDNEVATHLYRIAQEAAANALRHGRPSHIEIKLEADNGNLVLTIRDDGKGIKRTAGKIKGMGLQIMDYRARLLGGTLTVGPAPGGGTLVTCMLRKEQRP